MPTRVPVCPVSELPPGERRIVEVDAVPHSIGVFNVDGDYFALANVCPHHLAPLCEGTITGEMIAEHVGDFELIRDGEIITCPWHGWKFDITDGTSVFNPHAMRARTYEAAVETEPPAEEGETDEEAPYGAPLQGEEPPVETYDVDIEEEYVVLYV